MSIYTEAFGGNDAEYVSSELAKLGTPAPTEEVKILIPASEYRKLLDELQKLRSQVAARPTLKPHQLWSFAVTNTATSSTRFYRVLGE